MSSLPTPDLRPPTSSRWFVVEVLCFFVGVLCLCGLALGQEPLPPGQLFQSAQPCQACQGCEQPGCQQPINFAAPFPIWGVDSAAGCGCGEVGWDARGMIPWQEFAQGEYVGHARTPHVPEYRIREGDVVAVYYRRTREELAARTSCKSAIASASNRSRRAAASAR